MKLFGDWRDGDKRFVHQVADRLCNLMGLDFSVHRHRYRSVKREPPPEYGEPVKHFSILLAKKIVAPIDHGFDSLLAQADVTASLPMQGELMGEHVGDTFYAIGCDPARNQANGMRISIQLPTQGRYGGRIIVT
ncbi:hypothetical protein D3C87_1119900 [compost metagenome]